MKRNGIIAMAIALVILVGVLVAIRSSPQEDTSIPESAFTQNTAPPQEEMAVPESTSAQNTVPSQNTAIPETTIMPSPPKPQPEQPQCDKSYPDFCIPPNIPDLDCGEIQYSNFRVLPPDRHGFDRDNDGIGCEG